MPSEVIRMRSSRSQFVGLSLFLTALILLLTNGFWPRIHADAEQDLVRQIEPIGVVLHEIMDNYVEEPDTDKVVEGALTGMMNALDDHSSFVPPRVYQELREDTEGKFDGIGIQIKLDAQKNIFVFAPMPNSPASKAGIMAGDIIVAIDDIPAEGMSSEDAKDHIRGESGTVVKLKVFRPSKEEGKPGQYHEISVTRGKVPMPSLLESRVLDGGVAYVRVSDFKQTTSRDLAEKLKELEAQGMKSLVLDLRWNPGGLLSASEEVASLFLKKNTLVTYTKGRKHDDGSVQDEMTLYTQRDAVVPQDYPMIILVNEATASSSEIVTGALQFHKRALIVGAKTFGKGSVQTIIPLRTPKDSALRLTTALYYTPADVTINKHGILPDVEVAFDKELWLPILEQFAKSWEDDAAKQDRQNHGSISGDPTTETTIEDVQLKRAVEILREEPSWQKLLEKYHKDTKITQVAAADPSPSHREGETLTEVAAEPAANTTPAAPLEPGAAQ
jgi:carboxyl-terminal processing protease